MRATRATDELDILSNQAKEPNEISRDQAAADCDLTQTDLLTGCLNQQAIDECETSLIDIADSGAALMIFDLDHFENVNDSNGNYAGDAFLVHFCSLVRTRLPDSHDFIRLGGDKFLIAGGANSLAEAVSTADAIRKTVIATPLQFNGKIIRTSVSCGVAFKPSGTQTSIDVLLERARAHLYFAKGAGRNQVRANIT